MPECPGGARESVSQRPSDADTECYITSCMQATFGIVTVDMEVEWKVGTSTQVGSADLTPMKTRRSKVLSTIMNWATGRAS